MVLSSRVDRSDWLSFLSPVAIGALVIAATALSVYRETAGQGGVPLDDAWIHFQFARNLAHGRGFAFNPGTPTAGSTSPLWTLLLAAVSLAGGQLPLAGQVLSVVCFLALLPATYLLGERLTGNRWAAWLAAALVAVNGRMVWAGLSALETPFFALLSLVAIGQHLVDRAARRYRIGTAVLFALAALSRPEGYLLFALALADFVVILARRREAGGFLEWGRLPLLPALAFGALVLPYMAFSWRTSGHLLPNTYHAKAIIDGRPDLATLSVAARYLILDNTILLPFLVIGAGALLAIAPVLSLWAVGLPLVYAFLHVTLYQHGRYLMPLIPINALLAVVGLLETRSLATRRRWLARPAPAMLAVPATILALAGTGWRLPVMARLTAANVANINEMHVTIGQWIADNTPPDALLALNDIGAITYISERQVVDLAGLVTPDVVPLLLAPDRDELLASFMAERDVDYVVIFPNWFPELAARRDLLEPLYEVTLAENTIAGGERMVVYRAHWRS